MTEHMRNIMKYFKPVYFVWLLGIMLLIAVYFYGNKNLDFSQTNSNVKDIHYADATADIIFGDVNPSGKLPFSYPKTPAGFTTYDYNLLEKYDVNDYDPQWTFGYGLSYTTFAYSDLSVIEQAGIDYEIDVAVTVQNTGKVGGKETVELYITDLYGSVSRPDQQLKGFEKIYLEPGELKVVNFKVTPEHLAFHNMENKKVVEPGEFKVRVGSLIKSFTLN